MAVKNQKNNPLLLIALAIIFLFLISHFMDKQTVLGYNTKEVDLLIDIKPDSLFY